MTHTPTPWRVAGQAGLTIVGEDSHPIADTCFVNDEANAAFIVRAVNSHDALVSALKLIAGHDGLTLLGPVSDTERFHASGAAKAFADMAEIARDALARAAEKEEAA